MSKIALQIVGAAILFSTVCNGARAQGLSELRPVEVPPLPVQAAPLPRIMEPDIAWKKRIWRDIEVNKDANKMFAASANCPYSSMLVNILIGGVMSSKIKAYSAADDRFTTVLTKEELVTLLTSKAVSLKNGAKSGLAFDPKKVTKYQVKEDWIALKDGTQPFTRILGIAPLMEVTDADGRKHDQPLFWIYYPESRDYLAQHKVFGEKNTETNTWDKLLDAHQFDGYIKKISHHNTVITIN
jgi:gliding motility associated protien GldN